MNRFYLLVLFQFSLACGGSSTSPPDAAPSDPDAHPPECATEGEMRAGPCGNCGMGQQICQGGMWILQGACLGQGECSPGSTETGPLPLCGEEQRLCDNQCAWSAWEVTTPGSGDCEPGERRFDQQDCTAGLFRRQTCATDCTWATDPSDCVDGCGELPRATANEDEEEVCIPAGDFIRGQMGIPAAEPVATVTLSAYYIDRYVVTNRRYKACYDAGICGLPAFMLAQSDLDDPLTTDYPVWGVSQVDANAFCGWDGARRLLTEAEWEKAARGPAPRMNRYVWDDDFWRCDLLTISTCPGYIFPAIGDRLVDPYDAYPGDVSYYGVRGMFGAGDQWTHDFYDADYYSLPESLVDPQGPTAGTNVTFRGYSRHDLTVDTATIARRGQYQPTNSSGVSIIRCGRDAAGL